MQFLLILAFYHYFLGVSGSFKQNTSLTVVSLYQCNTNRTFGNRAMLISNPLFRSCDFNCCPGNRSNDTRDSDTCQVTVLSSNGTCTSRLCYSGDCTTLTNVTSYSTTISSTTILGRTRSSLPGPTLTNSTDIRWILWKIPNYSSIRSSALILLLFTNILLTLVTSVVVIKSIRHARILADKKSRRYSLF